ncbi:tetratricopeptide repeat protein [archaeon]
MTKKKTGLVTLHEMLKDLQKEIEKSPNDPVLWSLKGAHHYSAFEEAYDANDIDTAIKHYESSFNSYKRATELDPTDPVTFALLGGMLKQGRDFEGAITHFMKSIELKPAQPMILAAIAHSYVETGNMQGAERAADLALEFNPKEALAIYAKGVVHGARQEHKEAEQLLKKAIRLDPKQDYFFQSLGFQLITNGKHKDAKKAFLKSVELNPRNNTSLGMLSDMYLNEGNETLAEQMADDALRVNPYELNPWALNTKAYFYTKAGDQAKSQKAKMKEYERAEQLIKGAIHGLPNSVHFISNLVGLLTKMERYGEAEGWRKYVLEELDPSNKRMRDYKEVIALQKDIKGTITKSELEKKMRKMKKLSEKWAVGPQLWEVEAPKRRKRKVSSSPEMKKLLEYRKRRGLKPRNVFNPLASVSKYFPGRNIQYEEGRRGLNKLKRLQRKHLT